MIFSSLLSYELLTTFTSNTWLIIFKKSTYNAIF